MKTDSTQTNKPFNPTPTLALPLKGREIAMYLPFQGGGVGNSLKGIKDSRVVPT